MVATLIGMRLGRSGPSVRSRAASSACQVSSWASDSSVLCFRGGAVGGSHRVGLTVGQSAGSTSGLLSGVC
ncbi:MAG: hypothetical protein ACK56I_07705, partial [bacterium]